MLEFKAYCEDAPHESFILNQNVWTFHARASFTAKCQDMPMEVAVLTNAEVVVVVIVVVAAGIMKVVAACAVLRRPCMSKQNDPHVPPLLQRT